jgi:hypothetical protein
MRCQDAAAGSLTDRRSEAHSPVDGRHVLGNRQAPQNSRWTSTVSSEQGGGLAAPRVHQQPHGYRYKDGAPVSATPLSNAIVELDCRSGGPFEISLVAAVSATTCLLSGVVGHEAGLGPDDGVRVSWVDARVGPERGAGPAEAALARRSSARPCSPGRRSARATSGQRPGARRARPARRILRGVRARCPDAPQLTAHSYEAARQAFADGAPGFGWSC